ncbi:serine/threonine-protein kinase [Sorangium cellulosum]|uniref:serine/threonine-protein kinase n=1 Tax=Sorangium cellulosum TaxID=56 RepID=UPI0010111FE9|nr:serine/threonine-protein kinase [Sorangium cellulosum]
MAQAGSDTAEPASWRRIPRAGDIVAGKYRVERVLGRGGMGLVVAAHHVSLRHRVALKFLLPEGRGAPDAVARFFREAQAAAAIASEHIVRVIDVGHTDQEVPYFVMEYLSGIDLEALLDRQGPLPVERAVSHVIEACEAVAEAHALGIVHRDLKPGNLFLASRSDGSTLIKVLDFGISKACESGVLGPGAKLTTSSSVVLGSPRYMSPEHIRSPRSVDARSDIWALGVTLYQLLTARLPFDTEPVSALFVSIATDPPAPPTAHRPGLPVELERVVLMCLEKDPARRPQTIAELATLLEPLGSESARRKVTRILRAAMGDVTLDAPAAPVRPRIVDEDAQTLPGPPGGPPAPHGLAPQPPMHPASLAPAAGPSLAPAAGPSLAPAAGPSRAPGWRRTAPALAALTALLGGAAAVAWLGGAARSAGVASPSSAAASLAAPSLVEPAAAAEPAHAEPAYAEPAYAEPAYAEPAHAEPDLAYPLLPAPAAAASPGQASAAAADGLAPASAAAADELAPVGAAAADGLAPASAALAPASKARPPRPRAVLAPPPPTSSGKPTEPTTRTARLREHR